MAESTALIHSQREKLPQVYILVVGVVGAGKSTFIAKATGDTSIAVGDGLEGVTTEVQDYAMVHNGFEVHLIDTPGFDDSALSDHQVLTKIAEYVNHVQTFDWNLGGIIYMFDIARMRGGGGAELSIRVLEKLTGTDRWNNITLVTNRWGCSGNSDGESKREKELTTLSSYWKAMRLAERPAKMARFQNTRASALEIIEPHLDRSFVPAICEQMIQQELPIGRTGAGRVIVKKYTEAFEAMDQDQELSRMNTVMRHRFDAVAAQAKKAAMQLMMRDLISLEKKQMWQAVGRVCVRLAMWGGAVLVTLATENPAALRAAIAASGPLEWKLKKVKKSMAGKLTNKKEEIATTAVYGILDGQALKVGVEAPRIIELEDD